MKANTDASIRAHRYKSLTGMIIQESSVWGVDLIIQPLAGAVSDDANKRTSERTIAYCARRAFLYMSPWSSIAGHDYLRLLFSVLSSN